MKKLLTLVLAVMVTSVVLAQVKQTVTKAAVTYQIKNMGIKTSGKFGGFNAAISFDKANLSASIIEASVDVNTIDSDNEARDKHLKTEDYFDAARYPKITLKSVSFKQVSSGSYVGMFNVTIKGKTKLTEVPFTYTESAGTGLFKGSFKINRRDFGVGGNSLVLADEATIDLAVETSK